MAKNPSVVVVGSYIQDLSFTCETFPVGGQTFLGEFTSGPGGKGSNQAVAANRMGVDTAFVGAVGDDAFGTIARDFYKREGLDARIVTKKGATTGAAAVLVDAQGQNQIVVAIGANGELRGRDIPRKLIEEARVVVAQLETSLEATRTALQRGWDAGTITVLNPAPMRADFDLEILRFVDVLIPNESEFASLANRCAPKGARPIAFDAVAALSDEELGAICSRLGVPTVIVTLGKNGAYLWQGSGGRRYPILRGIKAVDTTGAGDAFVGGFAAGLVHFEGDLAKSVRFAITVSGLSVTKRGTSEAMPTQREVTAYLRKAKV